MTRPGSSGSPRWHCPSTGSPSAENPCGGWSATAGRAAQSDRRSTHWHCWRSTDSTPADGTRRRSWRTRASRSAESIGYVYASWRLRYTIAMLAAARGDDTVLAAQTEAMEPVGGPPRGRLGPGGRPPGQSALGIGQRGLSAGVPPAGQPSARPGWLTGAPVTRPLAMFDLVEAAVRTDRVNRSPGRTCRQSGDPASPSAHPGRPCSPPAAAAIASSASDLPDAFEQALAVPGVDRWPFELARVRLAYGARLRRAHACGAGRARSSPRRWTSLPISGRAHGRRGPRRSCSRPG